MKIASVSYLNSKPFAYGLERPEFKTHITSLYYPPHLCVPPLLQKEVDAALIPTGAFIKYADLQLAVPFCIASQDEVYSVILCSEVPLEQIKTIVLDHDSTTSVLLLKILCKNYWKISPVFIDKQAHGYEQNIQGTTAGLIIGDRAIAHGPRFTHRFDIARVWKIFTGLPCVFAVWASRGTLEQSSATVLSAALEYGLQHIPLVAEQEQPKTSFKVYDYFTKHLEFRIKEPHRKSIERFRTEVSNLL